MAAYTPSTPSSPQWPTDDGQAESFKLMYVEKTAMQTSSGPPSTSDIHSNHSVSQFNVKCVCQRRIAALEIDRATVDSFQRMLAENGIDTSKWGYNGKKTVEHLCWEALVQRACVLTGVQAPRGNMKRVTRLLKVRLQAEIYGVEHTLVSRLQFKHFGQDIERRQLPLKKLLWTNYNDEGAQGCDASFYSQDCPYTEDWRDACGQVLKDRLGLSVAWQEKHLKEDLEECSYTYEDNVLSNGFPGLDTLYCIHTVTVRVMESEHKGVQCIGLPCGREFATAEGDFHLGREFVPIGSQLNIWSWVRTDSEPVVRRKCGRKRSWTVAHTFDEAQLKAMKRVQCFSPAFTIDLCSAIEDDTPPNSVLRRALGGAQIATSAVLACATRIADPEYTLREYMSDICVHPELDLYLLNSNQADAMHNKSGLNQVDEYQRTVCAFFAIYWLMRLHIDGKEGFTYGVDDAWQPLHPRGGESNANRLYPLAKRDTFYQNAQWELFSNLLADAGLIEVQDCRIVPVPHRVATLLVVTAIHDIMKVDCLLPKVDEEHSPYHRYGAGDVIGDHDRALAYVLDNYEELLPSFMQLDDEEKRVVRFTQCQIGFNHGWFVQAEGPPGAVLTKFREVLIRDLKSQIKSRDIAFYFVHWLTDLAGAEPTPLGGCEKFVIKFPLPVLNSFLRSFEFVQRIAEQTEAEVMEEYLIMRWNEFDPPLGPQPRGDFAIAKMRLACMAQQNATRVVAAFSNLCEADREALCTELSRTGCIGQSFSRSLVPLEVVEKLQGPALLMYYSPAFLQNLGNDQAAEKLRVLAEVCRCAREFWPLSVAKAGTTVIVRMDTIKNLTLRDIGNTQANGELWIMVKHSESEAFIEKASPKRLNIMIRAAQPVQLLGLLWLSAA
eukprot:CAMPEP_0117580604 /NCGR_PEP_ID=MMETSP0784-20121206/65310_1 /TAXON_ID=39447 /ORGANISM="" /LENGTH=888 /DNA_ID=CAMNT_0005380715 /DNA_START=29 /DNA_END=2696 /DNA_ORIENTATION=-